MSRVILASFALIIIAALCPAQDEKAEKPAKPSVEQVRAKYSSQIMRLEGVVDVGLARRGEEELITVSLKDEKNLKLLDNLISDKLEGYGVAFDVTGEPQPDETAAPEKETAGEKLRGTPLCFKCTGPEYPSNQGLCCKCGSWTKSTAFKFCNDCARKHELCARCGEHFIQDKK